VSNKLTIYHQSCISEDQKYQGALYKEKNKKQKNEPASTPSNNHNSQVTKKMPQAAYVEDAGEEGEYGTWADYHGPTDDEKSPADPPPEAPTPPSAVPEGHVNVFDFLVASGQTPNASNLDLPGKPTDLEIGDSTSLVRYEYNAEAYLDMDDDVEYGTGPVPTGAYRTPAAKTERRKTGSETKKDKKRKRLHVDVPGDEVMTDAPPVLHSGLTGGLKSMMRSGLPPSPDYSGGDGPETPASPLKKTKHSKRTERTSLLGMITGSKSKSSKKRKTSSSSKKHSSKHAREDKMIEYRPHSKDGKADHGDGQVILYKPRADVFLSFVDKGPDSERGCSMNKALKRFHRERKASGDSSSKSEEEKELWRSLRLRQNERGEIVLFTI
jgi:cell growth-regulating nucleolar protein